MSRILITGGTGFIGVNASRYFASRGNDVLVFDNLSRKGAIENLDWLSDFKNIHFIKGDICKNGIFNNLVQDCDLILHLAGQVAVTTSVVDPVFDFQNNAWGTLNLLESVRKFAKSDTLFIFASTNKVYGGLENVKLEEKETRWIFSDIQAVNEDFPLDFHSPYGCSKGAADQYVHDYSRIYGLKTVVFRQSCIYGPRQFGIEDQGWIAWFIIAAILGKDITIYGDGKQVRDILYIDDLLDAFQQALSYKDKYQGEIFNIGGGIKNSISIYYEFFPLIENLLGRKITVNFAKWRSGDQKIYISDIKKAKNLLRWQPKVGFDNGIKRLFTWVNSNINLIKKYF